MRVTNAGPRLALALAVTLAACGGRAEMPTPGSAQPQTTLEVQNQASLDMTIYAIREGGERRRLGTAIAHQTTKFTIPYTMIFGVSDLRFQADPIGSDQAPVSEVIPVQPGDVVVMQIPPH